MYFFSPLEQFQIYPLISIQLGNFDFSFTNAALMISIGLIGFLLCLEMIMSSTGQFYFVPKHWQLVVENIYETVADTLVSNVGEQGQKYFPFIFTLFTFVLISNLIGLVPYSFTITSHIIVTFGLALMVFVGVTIISIKEHGLHMLSLFIPSGTSLALAFLLVPIEIISYVFRPISLSLRLFANMMAGHALLKVIAGFAWSMMTAGGLLFLAHFFPLVVLILLIGLELGVAFIQAYVFTILSCMYLNDAINLH
jgi:ATP synthase subunit 6|uniref:ATP synthase subunit a n=1 Tax=Heterosigma akashiwo TaxID=2829 RepID=D2Z268_HETAK|nr:ATP synthase F0 subunit 6 [Heterosigma akashiwo]ACS27137.1 ATP synthase F0 subunit 6 [Heterosigma akashiwo]ACS27176.1 ATP synthase F0 subunit 6 [Heterosigma akashiwo]AOR08495.1 ATP synthase F0 subunit 6 [Heterosigma akashiwo]AOT84804.1 ATP synthase F0 subunit 6 [Heterosigma akashiwo]AOT84846.1 ATP synthase F0 subunit 6 [Heterosigma akashiwo]